MRILTEERVFRLESTVFRLDSTGWLLRLRDLRLHPIYLMTHPRVVYTNAHLLCPFFPTVNHLRVKSLIDVIPNL